MRRSHALSTFAWLSMSAMLAAGTAACGSRSILEVGGDGSGGEAGGGVITTTTTTTTSTTGTTTTGTMTTGAGGQGGATPLPEDCLNGVDDDLDGLVDCEDDADCAPLVECV